MTVAVQNETPPREIVGILWPVYDADEGIVGLMLSARDEEEYVVEAGRLTDELIGLCREEVAIRGKVRMRDGRRIISVYDYRPTMDGTE